MARVPSTLAKFVLGYAHYREYKAAAPVLDPALIVARSELSDEDARGELLARGRSGRSTRLPLVVNGRVSRG
jgi:hypothetical protein